MYMHYRPITGMMGYICIEKFPFFSKWESKNETDTINTLKFIFNTVITKWIFPHSSVWLVKK